MGSREKFEHWLDIAQYDLGTAESMMIAQRWVYVMVMCQQAVEKLVKWLFSLCSNEEAPRTHNIRTVAVHLLKKDFAEIPEDTLVFFDTLSAYYIGNRYPDFIRKLSMTITRDEALAILQRTKEVFAWLLTLGPSANS